MQILISTIIIFSIASVCLAVDASNDKISMLREEIDVLENRILQSEAGKQGVIRQLQDVDRKMDLHSQIVRELQQRERDSAKRARHLRGRISDLQGKIEVLSENLTVEEAGLTRMSSDAGERLSYLYRHRSGDRLALLLASADLNDFSRRQRYLQAVAKFDHLRLDNLRRKRDKVLNDRRKLNEVYRTLTMEQARRLSELEHVRGLINDRRVEERELASEKTRKQHIIKRISSDTELLQAILDERKQSLDQIEWEIRRLEGRRPASRKVWQPDVPFSHLQGKLPWPLETTKILQPFGRHRHPELGTTTINPGIDLHASSGDPVYAVARGQVTKISWLRGFGNTVILSHSDGYYTVYARLGNIYVSESDIVGPGDPIGEVGDIGAENSFHFEVWSKRNKQDPILWLQ
ncbi:MAG: peptidoglycan DD-metalloendopeptidase family protein [Calditrichaeota bacterium]|nr:peptidoglycan DD-metalloendopeptidase family protein [Calditrichota bacterium]